MATHFEPDNSDTPPGAEASYQEEQASAEMEAPRRAASARFIVDSEVGSDAAIRDAMDPANQSLADALRMSFRVLQAVILVLVVLFLASGLRTVDEGKTGVRTRWGRIDADNRPEGGARVRVVLPMKDSTRSASNTRDRRGELRRERA